jgi:molecular chaperone DnaK (HSP70)
MAEAADIIGIDFGTTTSFVATPEAGIVPLGTRAYLPSIAGVLDQRLLVGEAAAVLPPDRLIRSAKRAISEGRTQVVVGSGFGIATYPRDLVITAIFKEIAARARQSGSSLRAARTLRFGCPAGWNQDQRRLLLDLAKAAGVPVENAEMIDEPVAAALEWLERQTASGRKVNGRLLAFDMGGGTLDVAVMDVDSSDGTPRIKVLSSADTTIAGDALDEAIYTDIVAHYQLDLTSMNEPARASQHILNLAIETKMRLSTDETHDIFPNARILGAEKLVPLRYQRERFNDVFGPMMDVAESTVTRALRPAGQAMSVDFVLLVGGMSRVPLVRQRLQPTFRHAEFISDYGTADEAVVRGLVTAGAGRLRQKAPRLAATLA